MPPSSLAVEGAIGGRALLVQAGMPMSSYDAADPTEPFRSAPRSAVGVDADGATGTAVHMYLVAVDGDQAELARHDRRGAGATSSPASASPTRSSSTAAARRRCTCARRAAWSTRPPTACSAGRQPPRRALRRAGALLRRRRDLPRGSSATRPRAISNATVTVDGQVATWHEQPHALQRQQHHAALRLRARVGARLHVGRRSAARSPCRTCSRRASTQYLSLVLYPGSDPPPDMARPPDMATDRAADERPTWRLARSAAPTWRTGGGAHSGCASAPGAVVPPNSGFIVALVLFLGAASIFRRRRE